jgi:pyrimidine operon attenuation protein/uracil phosphoribosyltransferase
LRNVWKDRAGAPGPEKVLGEREIDRILFRMAGEIIERNNGVGNVVLVGIRTGGVHVARALKSRLDAAERADVPMGIIDITLYRDDIMSARMMKPIVGKTEIPCGVDGRTIVLVDDVLYTGRTVRSALDALIDLGRPARIQLAVLVDRGHRELPILADFAGKSVPTEPGDQIEVLFKKKTLEPDKVVRIRKV